MTIVVQSSIREDQYKKNTLIQIRLTSLNEKDEENLYGPRSLLPEVDEGALAEKRIYEDDQMVIFDMNSFSCLKI